LHLASARFRFCLSVRCRSRMKFRTRLQRASLHAKCAELNTFVNGFTWSRSAIATHHCHVFALVATSRQRSSEKQISWLRLNSKVWPLPAGRSARKSPATTPPLTVARFGNKRPKRLVLVMKVLPNRSGVRKSSDNVKLMSESRGFLLHLQNFLKH